MKNLVLSVKEKQPRHKIFLVMYLLHMYYSNICIYVCAYVYHDYACKWLRICILVFSLLFVIGGDCVILFIYHTKI